MAAAAAVSKADWDSSKGHGRGTKVMRKSDGRGGVSTMDRDSDGEIRIRFDDDGSESSYINTRDVWALAASGPRAAAGGGGGGGGSSVSCVRLCTNDFFETERQQCLKPRLESHLS